MGASLLPDGAWLTGDDAGDDAGFEVVEGLTGADDEALAAGDAAVAGPDGAGSCPVGLGEAAGADCWTPDTVNRPEVIRSKEGDRTRTRRTLLGFWARPGPSAGPRTRPAPDRPKVMSTSRLPASSTICLLTVVVTGSNRRFAPWIGSVGTALTSTTGVVASTVTSTRREP